jgi:hypothetical protein
MYACESGHVHAELEAALGTSNNMSCARDIMKTAEIRQRLRKTAHHAVSAFAKVKGLFSSNNQFNCDLKFSPRSQHSVFFFFESTTLL